MESIIKNIDLAPSGELKINWVRNHMPILKELLAEFEREQPFKGKKIAICLHLEAKTAWMALVLQAGGAEVAVAGSNPLSTQDDVVAALVKNGITAFAKYNATEEEYNHYLEQLALFEPDLYIDDGNDFTTLLHEKHPEILAKIQGGCEETTTGVVRLRAMEANNQLKLPMVEVNNGQMKHLFDNRYGTGQSVWDAIMRQTNLVIAGKKVVVIGYGWCGKGVAMRAKGLGAQVIVTEINPVKATEAYMDGFSVMPLNDAAPLGDIFVTVTGNLHVIDYHHMENMKDGAILCNAGHFDVEINMAALKENATSIAPLRQLITGYTLPNNRTIAVICEGRLVNLAGGDGHPAEIMDLTFGLQVLSLLYVLKNPDLEPGLYSVPKEIDERVARIKLNALNLDIDVLTEEQIKYLESWN